MSLLKMADVNLSAKRVLIRQDLNVPIENNQVLSDERIVASLPTINYALKQNAKVILVSHLGRPIAGKFEKKFSLEPVAKHLSKILKKPVRFISNWLDGFEIEAGEVVLCENVRFQIGETENDSKLAKKMANICDICIQDAFGVAHRTHASTNKITKFVDYACAGPLLIEEITQINKFLHNTKSPKIAIVGGSKVSTKLSVLQSIAKNVDYLIVGGGIANTFIAAKGYSIGKSLYEKDLIPEAQKLIKKNKIFIPSDVVCAKEFNKKAKTTIKDIANIEKDDMIFDIGENSIIELKNIIQLAKTIFWNGPLGVFEFDNFNKGTENLAKAIAASKAVSIAGGGDTIAAIKKYNIKDKISYISTGGGAFLELIRKSKLPVIAALEASTNKNK